MDYIDRKKLGIESLFAVMSPILSRMNELNAEETVERLYEQPYNIRARLAEKINSGIRVLTKDTTVDAEEYINDDIKELAKYPVSGDTMSRLLPFFKWLMEIQRQNALEIEKSRYMLNDAAANMDRQTGDFLRAFAGSTGQNISILREGDVITISVQEKFWGKASLVFPDVETKFCGTYPIVGFLFWPEAEHRNGRFKFNFLLDVEFGDNDNDKRAVQDRNWLQFTFECSCPQLKIYAFDYGKTLVDFGKCGHDFINSWCGELLSKESALGNASLSEKEKNLLPIAKIFRLSYQLSDMENGDMADKRGNDNRLSERVLETLENRYSLGEFEELFKSTHQDELYKLLTEAMDSWSYSDFEETSKKIWEFAHALRLKELSDDIRLFYKKITELMLDCTSEFCDKSRLYGTYSEAEEKMRQTIEPNLISMGFSGEYPHYRRRRKKRGEYITVRTANVSEHSMNGVMKYRFSVSAAVNKLATNDKVSFFSSEIPFEETTAEDFRSVSRRKVKFAELGGDVDNVVAVINVDIFDGIQDAEKSVDNAELLNSFAELAEKNMRGKKAPRRYKKMRRASPIKFKPETTFKDCIIKYLPWGLYLSLVLTLIYMLLDELFVVTDYIPWLTSSNAIIAAVVIGLLTAAVRGLIKMRSLKKHIWWY